MADPIVTKVPKAPVPVVELVALENIELTVPTYKFIAAGAKFSGVAADYLDVAKPVAE